MGARVRALDPATGAELWRHDFPGSTRAGFAYDQGRVYVVHQTGIHALAAATGALLWSDPRNSASLASSPTALDGELYVSSNYATTRYRGDTGEKVWTAGGCCSPTDRAPSVDATRVYAGNVCDAALTRHRPARAGLHEPLHAGRPRRGPVLPRPPAGRPRPRARHEPATSTSSAASWSAAPGPRSRPR